MTPCKDAVAATADFSLTSSPSGTRVHVLLSKLGHHPGNHIFVVLAK